MLCNILCPMENWNTIKKTCDDRNKLFVPWTKGKYGLNNFPSLTYVHNTFISLNGLSIT